MGWTDTGNAASAGCRETMVGARQRCRAASGVVVSEGRQPWAEVLPATACPMLTGHSRLDLPLLERSQARILHHACGSVGQGRRHDEQVSRCRGRAATRPSSDPCAAEERVSTFDQLLRCRADAAAFLATPTAGRPSSHCDPCDRTRTRAARGGLTNPAGQCARRGRIGVGATPSRRCSVCRRRARVPEAR